MNHDISHCQGLGGDICQTCYRYLAHLEALELKMEHVWYFAPPEDATSHSCSHYYRTSPKIKK